jgi:tRNA 2-thiouridine synthesizing protein E
MGTQNIAGVQVELDEKGFFAQPDQWSREMAPLIAAEDGIAELTARHWEVIDLMRSEYADKGTGLAVRALSKESGVPIKELYQLFPGGPAKQAARIAGIPKPRGCI